MSSLHWARGSLTRLTRFQWTSTPRAFKAKYLRRGGSPDGSRCHCSLAGAARVSERVLGRLHETGQVVSSYWPGFALLLTPFEFFGVPWLCNPVLGALTVLVLHRLALELVGSRELAGLAVLLGLASTAVSINSISFYSMTAHALANAIFALLLLKPDVGGVCWQVSLVQLLWYFIIRCRISCSHYRG